MIKVIMMCGLFYVSVSKTIINNRTTNAINF